MELLVDTTFAPEEGRLSPDESRHCVSVMRHRVGDNIYISNGTGVIWRCRLTEANARGCLVEIIEEQAEPSRSFSLIMAVALTKNIDRFEWFVEKATEMRIERIIPLVCEHSERVQVRLDRLQRVVIAAAKQSLKARLPIVEEPRKAIDLIRDNTYANTQRFIMHCDAPVSDNCTHKSHLLDLIIPGHDLLLLIGPEGDFSQSEIEEAVVRQGFIEATLGDERLRTETAAMTACHIGNLANRTFE